MKFDMTKAWNDAVALISGNREVLLIVAGVFFFLPGLASTLLTPKIDPPVGLEGAEAANYMVEVLASAGPVLFLMGLIQAAGLIALLTLLNDAARPTVGEAIKAGLIGLIPYIASQILLIIGLAIPIGAIVGLAALTGSSVVTSLVFLAATIFMVYALVKTSLMSPVIAIEKTYNPIKVLVRSWRLTKGNSVRLLAFYLLLLVVYLVLAMLIGGVFSLLIAMLGDGTASLVVEGLISGLLGALVSIVTLGIMASIHRQLSGPDNGAVAETFE